jgi:hypothetical protein
VYHVIDVTFLFCLNH